MGSDGDSAFTPSDTEPQMSSDPLGVHRPLLAACGDRGGQTREEAAPMGQVGGNWTGAGGERSGQPLCGRQKDRRLGQLEGRGEAL